MKKIIIAIVLFCSVNVFSQSQSSFKNSEYHEPKVNLGYLLLGNFDVSYERLLTAESGLGLNLMIPFDYYIDWNINYNLTGYHRFYFGEGYADGFFAEVFANLNSIEDRIDIEDTTPVERIDKEIIDLALGIRGGYKLVSNGGVVLEAFLGGGRNLFS